MNEDVLSHLLHEALKAGAIRCACFVSKEPLDGCILVDGDIDLKTMAAWLLMRVDVCPISLGEKSK